MRFFLLVYDRAEGRLLDQTEFSDRAVAMRARFDHERIQRGNLNVEVVVLGAGSADVLRQTHARYYNTVSEIAGRGLQPA